MAPLDHNGAAEELRRAFDDAEIIEPDDILNEFIDPTTLFGTEPPDREWIVQDWLPVGSVTSLYGGAGYGKTLLAQQLQTAVSAGQTFLGLETMQCPVLAVYCEDDGDELHRRQSCINRQAGISMLDLGGMRYQGRFGKDNVMGVIENGVLTTTDMFNFVLEAAKKFGARLVIIDNIAQVFAGNEVARSDVTQFVNALGRVAQEINGAVLLLGHPAKATDSEYSGSTAWDAAVRSRWILERPKSDPDEPKAGEMADLRVLRKAKANYSGTGDEIPLQWEKGCFRLKGRPIKDKVAQITEANIEHADNAAFLAGLRTLLQAGFEPSYKIEARSSYAPKLLRKAAPECKSMSVETLRRAMEHLMQSGEIVFGWSAGPPSRRKAIIVPKGHSCAQRSDTYGQGAETIDTTGSQTAYEHSTDTYGQSSQVIDIATSDWCSDTPLYTTYIEGSTLGAVPPSDEDVAAADAGGR